MLTNSLLAGALGAAYLTVLVLQLNPQVPLASASTLRWFATLGLSYGLHLAVLFYVLLVAREFFSMDAMSPGWASVRVLAWLAAASAAAAAVLMWLNVEGLRAALDDAAARRMTAGAAAATTAAIVLLVIAAAHYSFGRRGSRVGATLFVMAVFGSLALPLAARGPAVVRAPWSIPPRAGVSQPAAPQPHVRMLLLDGASLEYVWPRAADGRLPNFARLLDGGASMDLATVRPTAPDPVWAAVATGIYPGRNGVRSAAAYFARGDAQPVDLLPDHCFSHALVQLGFVRDVPNSSDAWRARPLWSILSAAGVSVGIVRWPLTYPAQPVEGFLLSDRFHEVLGSMSELGDGAAFPAEIVPVARAAFGASAGEADPGPSGAPAGGQTNDTAPKAEAGSAESAARRDRQYSRALHDLLLRRDVQFSAIRYQGLDTFGHYYMRFTQRELEEMPESTRRRSAEAIDRYYAFIDSEIGAAIDAVRPGDLLLVVSGFGMQRQNAVKQLLARIVSGEDVSGTHERAPDGFLLAYGTDVEPGRHKRGSVVDVTPTVLYFLGIPVGRDMDGFARADLFTSAYTAERPIAFIPSHR